MATLSKDGRRNSWRIIFSAPDRLRRTIYLGPVQKKFAEQVRGRVEILAERLWTKAALTPELAEWVTTIDPKLRIKLVNVGLVEPTPEQQAVPLGRYLETFLETRQLEYKRATLICWGLVVRDLNAFFGSDKDIRTIDQAAAEGFRQSLIKNKLRPTTIQKRLQHARMFFGRAKKAGHIAENPFLDVRHRGGDVAERRGYVSVETAMQVISHAPDHDWRLMIALSRFAGLRCPSETLSLRWADIDWERNRMLVQSPKTEHINGKGSRTVPLFGVVRLYLQQALERAPQGAIFCIDETYRARALGPGSWANANLRTRLSKIIRRAGKEQWPRLWHTLRASCETDLASTFPLPVVAKWLGNTPTIAYQHYISVTDTDFSRATSTDPFNVTGSAQKGALRATETLPNPLQAEPLKVYKGDRNPDISLACSPLHTLRVEDRGLEPDTKSPGNKESVDSERTKERTLEQLSANWSTLSAEARALVEKLSDGLSTKAPPHAVHFGGRVR